MRETSTLSGDERGVSTTVTYSLTVLITTILITGLIYAASTTVKTERESAARNELTVVGERLTREIAGVGALADAGADSTVRMRVDHPRQVVGATYSVEVQPGGSDPCDSAPLPCLVLTSENPDVTVTVPFNTTANVAVAPSTVRGGELLLVYDPGTGEITLEVR